MVNGQPAGGPSSPSSLNFPTRHPDYYFDDGSLVILVENTLFNVHRSTFTRHSRVFKDVFTLPVPAPGQVVEGSADECPLQFPGIPCTDFVRLLWILYPPTIGKHKPQTVSEWTSILHLATRWEFDSIRTLAINSLEPLPMSPVDKVVLSREFDVRSLWTLAAYTELCERPEALTIKEARTLGLETAMRIAQLRERLRSGVRPGVRSPMRRSSAPVSSPKPTQTGHMEVVKAGPRRESLPRTSDRYHGTPTIRRPLIGKASRTSEASRLAAEVFGLNVFDTHE